MLTNDVISFEQPDPSVFKGDGQWTDGARSLPTLPAPPEPLSQESE